MNSEQTATAYADLIRALNKAAIITETDLDGRITFVNSEFCRISGYSETELLGKTHSIVNSGIHSKDVFIEMWTTVRDGRVWFGEICNRAKDGHLYWLQATILPIFREENGNLYKYAAIRFDITEKKARELELKKKAALYQAAIETTDGFARLNMKGDFVEVSDGYCSMTGYSRDELLQLNINELDATNDPIERAANFNALLSGSGKTLEIERKRKDGSLWVAEITSTYTPLDNGSIFVFLHDISERKEMENRNEMLRQEVNQMQKLDSIGRLTAGIAHDFNNVLACILGYNEFNNEISNEMPDSPIKTELSQNINQVEIAAKRAVELINKLLTYSRQKSDKKIKEIKPTFQAIEEVVNMLRSGLTSKFQIELNLDQALNVDIDAIDMHQVMTNLLVNARDAMKKKGNGTIKIQLQTVHNLDCQCDACYANFTGSFIELSVSDSGTGIDKASKMQIFDPFFTTKNVGEGTGLGLSVVNGIVRHAGGHILIDSEQGVGTTFRLLFPLPKNES
jgi:PAS domain S-box-containing protein